MPIEIQAEKQALGGEVTGEQVPITLTQMAARANARPANVNTKLKVFVNI